MSTEPQFLEQKKHQIWFFLLSVILFAVSLGIAFLGVFYGARVLQALNADGKIDLQTMGELLGGTLGVAVAFAGAWVAFKIASFANQTLVLQERREASRTANETLEKSIGKILEVQLHFEALLRHIDDFAQFKAAKDNATTRLREFKAAKDNATTRLREFEDKIRQLSDYERRQYNEQVRDAHATYVQQAKDAEATYVQQAKDAEDAEANLNLSAELAKQAAKDLSVAIQNLLTNPLAISVLFALQEAKPEGQRATPQRLLTDLTQLPRIMDQLRDRVAKAKDTIDYRFPSIMLQFMYQELPTIVRAEGGSNEVLIKLNLELGGGLHEEASRRLGPVEYFAANVDPLADLLELREPYLIVAMRYFVYSSQEARLAIATILNEKVLADDEAREMILQSRPFEAFYTSGDINDQRAASYLETSRLLHQDLHSLSDELITGDGNSPRALAVRRLAIDAAVAAWGRELRGFDLPRNIMDEQSKDELLEASRRFSAYQIYLVVYLSLKTLGAAKLDNWCTEGPKQAIRLLRNLRSALILRDKLLSFAPTLSMQSYGAWIFDVVQQADLGNALPELDSLQLTADDLGDTATKQDHETKGRKDERKKGPPKHRNTVLRLLGWFGLRPQISPDDDGRFPEPQTLFYTLLRRLNVQIAESILRQNTQDERESVARLVSGLRTIPRAIRFTCTAYRKFPDAEAPAESVEARFWKSYQMVESRDHRALCVIAESYGLQAELTPGGVDISDPTTGLTGCLVAVGPDNKSFRMECRAPSGVESKQLEQAMSEVGANGWRREQSRDGKWWFKLEKGWSYSEFRDDLLMAQEIYKRAQSPFAAGDQTNQDNTFLKL